MSDTPKKTDADWRAALSPLRFHVLREAGTERPFVGRLTDTTTPGLYVCGGCQAPLFRSEAKFHSGCGWPSFFDDLGGGVVRVRIDRSHGMVREEILCAACDGHLGHVFDDGPPPTGRRYCVNSASIDLLPDAPGSAPVRGA
jgi:peptide-methionine (R)-S-oxide reductase